MIMRNLNLINAMAEKGIAGIKLAKKTGISRSKISGARSGAINLTEKEEEKIAEFLNCKREEIFPFTGF